MGIRRRTRWEWTFSRMVVGIAAVVLLTGAILLLVISPSFLSGGNEGSTGAEAQTTSTGALQGLEGLPQGYAGGGEAAPHESGGEPFRVCATCHPDFLEKPGAGEDLIFSHPLHLDQEVGCVTCHKPPLGHFGNPGPLMMRCLESCHQGETAPNDCDNCHRRIEEIAPGLDEAVVHLNPDAATRESCQKCHDVEVWCERCHGLEMPHPSDWRSAHGPEVDEEGSEACVKCHQSRDDEFCIRCHGVPMPHSAYWFSGHGTAAQRDETVCGRCHQRAPQYCNECHHAGYSPTDEWSERQHGEVVSSGEEADECLICHGELFCLACHGEAENVLQR